MMAARPGGQGRHDLQRVPEPIAGYPALPSSVQNTAGNVQPVAAVDPYDTRKRVRALARIDLLDRERRNGHLDEASYLVGREIERTLERMNRISGGGQWWEGDRVDGSTSAELKAVLGLEKAYEVNAFLGWIHRNVGPLDTRLLWIILGNRWSFENASIALFPHLPGVRRLRYTIDRFRDCLMSLAECKAAKGRQLR